MKKLPAPKVIEQNGERMITVTLKFWTNGIPTGDGAWTGRKSKKILPKHAHPKGTLEFGSNTAHNIKGTTSEVKFNGLHDLVPKLLKEAKALGVVFVPLGRGEFKSWRAYLDAGAESTKEGGV